VNRILTILSSALLTLPLAACGGAGDPIGAVSSAQLQGSIVELDGQTLQRDGVDIRIVETGDHIMTSGDGSFAFPDLEPGWYTLAFGGTAVSALALEEAPAGEAGTGEKESEEDEDELGRPRCEIDGEGPVVIVKVVLESGEVVRWSKSRPGRRFVRARLERCTDADVRGQVRVAWREGGEVQAMGFRVCGLAAGAGAILYLRDGKQENAEWQLVDDASADAEGCATFSYHNLEGGLPLDKESVDALAGYAIEIRDTEGNCLVKGEIPALPEKVERDGEPEVDLPEAKPPVYGKDRLIAKVDGVFGAVAISRWGERDLDRFEMFAGGLGEGEQVKFQIRRRESEEWVTFATPTAAERDREGVGYVAIVDTEWSGALPLDAESVEQLEGLGVRVVRTTGEGEQVILIGEIPNLIR